MSSSLLSVLRALQEFPDKPHDSPDVEQILNFECFYSMQLNLK